MNDWYEEMEQAEQEYESKLEDEALEYAIGCEQGRTEILSELSVKNVGVGFRITINLEGLELVSYKIFDTEDEAHGYIEYLRNSKQY